MASFSPRCEIRQLAVFVDPGGIKAPDADRTTVFYGRRSRPVKKPRFIPAQLAHQLARKLQSKRLGIVAVCEPPGARPLPRWACGKAQDRGAERLLDPGHRAHNAGSRPQPPWPSRATSPHS